MTNIIARNFAMASIEAPLLQSKFRGSLLGCLLGDCLGAPFEGNEISAGDKITINKYFDRLEDPTLKSPFRPYTDDTAMMKSVATFLIDKPDPDFAHLAKLFVREYYASPDRGYGGFIPHVFSKLKRNKFEDVFGPASEQFNGSGSFGNGGAMRIAPIALFYYNDYENMIEVAKKSTEITHAHPLGIFGAVLQCIAVQQALLCDPNEPIDAKAFCEELCEKMKLVESSGAYDELNEEELITPYVNKLKEVQRYLQKPFNDDLDDDIIFHLGNTVTAYESVPTAIYCFLRALNEIPTVKTDNVFRRTIQYAITLGGDADTIACMSGAIAGAYLGDTAINPNIIKQCEFHKNLTEIADKLFNTKQGLAS